MRRISSIRNGCQIETFVLSEEQHGIAVDMVRNNKRKVGNYTLEEVDSELPNVWIADAHAEGDEEYVDFLREAIAANAEILVLTDHLGDFSLPIGEVAVY